MPSTWIPAVSKYIVFCWLQHGVGVEFVRVLPETHAPSLTNVFSECAPNDDVVSSHSNFHRSLIYLTTLPHLLSFASFGSKLGYHICLFSLWRWGGREGGREGERESVGGGEIPNFVCMQALYCADVEGREIKYSWTLGLTKFCKLEKGRGTENVSENSNVEKLGYYAIHSVNILAHVVGIVG